MEARDAHTIESIHKQNARETRSCYRTKQLSNTNYNEVIRKKKMPPVGQRDPPVTIDTPTQRFRRNVNPYPNHFVNVFVSPTTCTGASVPHRDTLTPPNFWQPSHVLNWVSSLNDYLPDRSVLSLKSRSSWKLARPWRETAVEQKRYARISAFAADTL